MGVREIQWEAYGQTDFHPVALLLTLAMGVWLLRAHRSRALLPIAIVACLIPFSQRIVVASLDFHMLRILVLFGWARLLMRGELQGLRPNRLDLLFCAWMIVGTLIHTLRDGTLSTLVYRLGASVDALGFYFLFRALARSTADIVRSLYQLTGIAVVMGASMTVEQVTGYNLFSLLGGVSEFTGMRDGRFRCKGAFSHPIKAGSFGAGLAPLFVGMWIMLPRRRLAATAGFIGATLIAVLSASSGPAVAYVAGMSGWALWSLRSHMRLLRWSAVMGLVAVHFGREKPVWHLAVRVADVLGGTGWHRYKLVDEFVNRVDEWWLLGTDNMKNWGWSLQDVTNHYIMEAVRGGLATMLVFFSVLFASFQSLGNSLKAAARSPLLAPPQARQVQLLAWTLGVGLATHCVSLLSVTYFGQVLTFFYLNLALVSALQECPEIRAGRAVVSVRRSALPLRRRPPLGGTEPSSPAA